MSRFILNASPHWQYIPDKRSPLDEGCKVVKQKAWPFTIVGNVFG